MFPFLPIVASLVPELIKFFGGDKSDKVADEVEKVIKQITGAADPNTARQVVQADPKIAADLQAELARIAIEATKAQNEAAAKKQQLENEERQREREKELQEMRAMYEEADKRRVFDLEQMKQSLADMRDARDRLAGFARENSPMQWGAPAVSLAVIFFFFIILTALLNSDPNNRWTTEVSQIINITIGALVAAFTAVVNFWIGSSQGSRDKDDLIKQQTTRTIDVIQSSSAAGRVVPAGPAERKPPSAKPDNFDRCMDIVFRHEGGFVDHPQDPGGATNYGITHRTLADWRGKDVTVDDVKNLSKKEAAEIFKAKYWIAARCGELPSGVDLAVFDFAVNSGPARAIKFLQRTVGAMDDGVFGAVTLGAVNVANPKEVISELCARRLEFLQGLSTFKTFGRGWTSRVNDVQSKALAMVA